MRRINVNRDGKVVLDVDDNFDGDGELLLEMINVDDKHGLSVYLTSSQVVELINHLTGAVERDFVN